MSHDFYWNWEEEFKIPEIRISRKRSLLDYINKLEYYNEKIIFYKRNGGIKYKIERTLGIYYAVRNKLIEKSIKTENF